MPLARFVLILVLVVIVAGLTVWVGALFAATAAHPLIGIGTAIPVLLIAYVVVRVVRDRMQSDEDRHYDRIEK